MSLSLQKAALGTAIMTKQLPCVTITNFTYQQNQVDKFESTVVSGHYLSISMRIKSVNFAAQQLYGYADSVPFQVFNTPFATSYQVTAANLRTLLVAAFPDLLVTEGGGIITISTNGNYGLAIEYEYYRYLTYTSVTRPFDMVTYDGDAILTATASGADVRYSEDPITSITPTSAIGELVVEGNPFDIVGKRNIMQCQFIESGGTALVDYTIYI